MIAQACPNCGSSEVKRGFLGGARVPAWIMIVLGAVSLAGEITVGKVSLIPVLALFAGFTALVMPPLKCKSCQARFRPGN
jgi:hypothetical protein